MVEMVPIGGAVVGDVKSAVAADDHVPAVARIDPQDVAVGVHLSARIALKRLASVLRAIHRDAQDIDIFVVARVDADAAEIHGPGIETIDAGPGFAAVGGFVDAAVLEAVVALAVLNVYRLAT